MKSAEFETMCRVGEDHWWYEALRRIIREHWRAFVLPGTAAVLDAGCGTGAMLRCLDSLDPARLVVGIDCSPVAIGLCRRLLLSKTAVASLVRLPFADATFDVVISCDVLCHEAVTDCATAMGEMARVLKPGGVLMMNLPAHPWLLSSHDSAVANVRRFTKGDVLQLLETHSLSLLRVTYWNMFLFLPIVGVRLWRRIRPAHQSDLNALAGGGTVILSAIMALEILLMRAVRSLPVGVSLFVVARKDTGDRGKLWP